MNEKLFKTISSSGIGNLVMGIILITVGVATGVLLLISGGRLIKSKHDLMI